MSVRTQNSSISGALGTLPEPASCPPKWDIRNQPSANPSTGQWYHSYLQVSLFSCEEWKCANPIPLLSWTRPSVGLKNCLERWILSQMFSNLSFDPSPTQHYRWKQAVSSHFPCVYSLRANTVCEYSLNPYFILTKMQKNQLKVDKDYFEKNMDYCTFALKANALFYINNFSFEKHQFQRHL